MSIRPSKVKIAFQTPEEEGLEPFIYVDTMDLLDAAVEQGVSEHSPLLDLIHQAGGEVDFHDLLEAHIMEWEPASRPEAAEAIAEWLEAVANALRRRSYELRLELKPRMSPRM
ncbi:Uncharacterised protein [Pseudomonas putida]|nr:Uncharacterised protein [Pseudomonas putida]